MCKQMTNVSKPVWHSPEAQPLLVKKKRLESISGSVLPGVLLSGCEEVEKRKRKSVVSDEAEVVCVDRSRDWRRSIFLSWRKAGSKSRLWKYSQACWLLDKDAVTTLRKILLNVAMSLDSFWPWKGQNKEGRKEGSFPKYCCTLFCTVWIITLVKLFFLSLLSRHDFIIFVFADQHWLMVVWHARNLHICKTRRQKRQLYLIMLLCMAYLLKSWIIRAYYVPKNQYYDPLEHVNRE